MLNRIFNYISKFAKSPLLTPKEKWVFLVNVDRSRITEIEKEWNKRGAYDMKIGLPKTEQGNLSTDNTLAGVYRKKLYY
ncbi:MAG: hypothetical protein AB2826_19505 [Candidatus Thiodiazotropha sp.]